MALPKLFNKIIFHNNTSPALNESNMNAISQGLSDVDDRVILLAGDVIEKAHDIMELSENPPYIGENGNWYVWDTETGAYVDSGVDASISVEIADVTMLPVGSTPYVTNTGTSTDPVFHLFIPSASGSYNDFTDKPKINGTTLSGSGQGNSYALTDISMVAKYMPSTNIVPTGQTYEKGAIVWVKGAYGQHLRRMNEDAAAGSNWINKSSAVTLNDLINALYTNVENEVITRASLGAHNLLPNTAKTTTVNGITFTVNDDKSVTVSTGAGGATQQTSFIIFEDVASWKNMVMTGTPAGASGTTYDLYAYDTVTSGENSLRGDSNVVLSNITNGNKIRVAIRIRRGVIITTPITFYPMIRLASDSDSTYQPYAKTNKQLTDNVTDIETAIAPIEIGTASQAYDKGDYLIMNDKLYKATTAIVSGATLIVGTNIEQTSVAEELLNTSNKFINKTIKPSATVTAGAWVSDVFNLPTPTDYTTYTLFNASTGAYSHLTKKSSGEIFSEVNILNNFYNICGINL